MRPSIILFLFLTVIAVITLFVNPVVAGVVEVLAAILYFAARRFESTRSRGVVMLHAKAQLLEQLIGSREKAEEALRLASTGVIPGKPLLVKRENIVGSGRGYILYVRSPDAPFINMLPYVIYKYYRQYRKAT